MEVFARAICAAYFSNSFVAWRRVNFVVPVASQAHNFLSRLRAGGYAWDFAVNPLNTGTD